MSSPPRMEEPLLTVLQARHEMRNTLRIPCRISVSSCVELSGEVLDLNQDGLTVIAAFGLEPGDQVRITCSLAGQLCTLYGRAIWIDALGRAGIRCRDVLDNIHRSSRSYSSTALREPRPSGQSAELPRDATESSTSLS